MWALALFALLSGLAAEASIPRISYDDLLRVGQEKALLDLLRDDGGRFGAFAVTDIPVPSYGNRLSGALFNSKNICLTFHLKTGFTFGLRYLTKKIGKKSMPHSLKIYII